MVLGVVVGLSLSPTVAVRAVDDEGTRLEQQVTDSTETLDEAIAQFGEGEGATGRVADAAGLAAALAEAMADLAREPVETEEGALYVEWSLRILAAQAMHAVCGQIVKDHPTIAGVNAMLVCLGPVNATVLEGTRIRSALYGQLLGLSEPTQPLPPDYQRPDRESLRDAATALRLVRETAEEVGEVTQPVERLLDWKDALDNPRSFDDLIEVSGRPEDFGDTTRRYQELQDTVYAEVVAAYASGMTGSATAGDFADAVQGASDPLGMANLGIEFATTAAAAIEATPAEGTGSAQLMAMFRSGDGGASAIAEPLKETVADLRAAHTRLVNDVLLPWYAEMQTAGSLSSVGAQVAERVVPLRERAFLEATLLASLRHTLGWQEGSAAYLETGGSEDLAAPAADDLVVPGIFEDSALLVTVEGGPGVRPGERREISAELRDPSIAPDFDPSAVEYFAVSGSSDSQILDATLTVGASDVALASVPSSLWIVGVSEQGSGMAQLLIVDEDTDADVLGDSWETAHGLDPDAPDDAIAMLIGIEPRSMTEALAPAEPSSPASAGGAPPLASEPGSTGSGQSMPLVAIAGIVVIGIGAVGIALLLRRRSATRYDS